VPIDAPTNLDVAHGVGLVGGWTLEAAREEVQQRWALEAAIRDLKAENQTLRRVLVGLLALVCVAAVARR
jgi:hypothetical protein